MATNETDIIVIGSGAAGGALTWKLTELGAKVICLEQGGWTDPLTYPSGRDNYEVELQRGTWWTLNEPQDYPVRNTGEFNVGVTMVNAVGGTTVHWQGLFPRFHPSDFRVRTLDGIADDWPIDYQELEPYYNHNESIIGISGLEGDPATPPRMHQTPPLPIGKVGKTMAAGFDKLGWHWWPTSHGIISEPFNNRPGCMLHGKCMMGCPIGAKASTDRTYWPAAIEKGAEIRTWSRVREIVVNDAGKATGVRYYDKDGQLHELNANVVVVCCNGIGTPRLLLNSVSKVFPDGLGNNNGVVGKNFMVHPGVYLSATFEESMDGHIGPMGAPVWSHHFYETDTARDFYRGYSLIIERTWGPLKHALGGRRDGSGVRWGRQHHDDFARLFPHQIGMHVFADDLPEVTNEITLDKDNVDSTGMYGVKINYALGENTRKMLEHGTQRGIEVFEAAGARSVENRGIFNMAHLMGTARMGDDPRNSVVDRNHKVHNSENVYVVDGSSFTTGAGVNPTATIMALALRAADKIWEGRREFS